MSKSELEIYFEDVADEREILLHKEYRFHPERRWRFDYADVEHKIAIELEGGVWVRGRHNRGAGYIKDTKKYNAATVLGWRVLRYCTVDDIAEHFIEDYTNLLQTINDG